LLATGSSNIGTVEGDNETPAMMENEVIFIDGKPQS
jgi:hypothetical protein